MTETQQKLIERALAAGYGYALFASSVKKQGWCSAKQEIALRKMLDAYEYRKNNWRGWPDKRRGSVSISDGEAMRSGDFF